MSYEKISDGSWLATSINAQLVALLSILMSEKTPMEKRVSETFDFITETINLFESVESDAESYISAYRNKVEDMITLSEKDSEREAVLKELLGELENVIG